MDGLRFVLRELVGQIIFFRAIWIGDGRILSSLRAECFKDAAGVMAAAHGHASRARDLKNLEFGFAQDLEKTLDLRGGAGHLEHDGFRRKIYHAGTEDIG
jgi:hypothetical protein